MTFGHNQLLFLSDSDIRSIVISMAAFIPLSAYSD
jgi:hypothetical protein